MVQIIAFKDGRDSRVGGELRHFLVNLPGALSFLPKYSLFYHRYVFIATENAAGLGGGECKSLCLKDFPGLGGVGIRIAKTVMDWR